MRLRLRADGSWRYLARDPLKWRGPHPTAREAFEVAGAYGHLFWDHEVVR